MKNPAGFYAKKGKELKNSCCITFMNVENLVIFSVTLTTKVLLTSTEIDNVFVTGLQMVLIITTPTTAIADRRTNRILPQVPEEGEKT